MNILIVYYSINIKFLSKLVSQNHHPNMFVKVSLKKNTSATTDSNINHFSQTNFYPNQLLKNHIEKKTFLHHFPHTLKSQLAFGTWNSKSWNLEAVLAHPFNL